MGHMPALWGVEKGKQCLTVGVVAREPRIVAFECHYGIVGQVEDIEIDYLYNSVLS